MDYIGIYPPQSTDAFAFYACVDRNRDHLTNLEWLKDATEESTAKFIDKMIDSRLEDFRLIIEGEVNVIGCITLRDRGEHLEIGYWLDHAFRGKGVVTRLVGEHIADAADKPVIARVRIGNWASRRVLTKNGFTGTLQEDGEWIIYRKEI